MSKMNEVSAERRHYLQIDEREQDHLHRLLLSDNYNIVTVDAILYQGD